MAEPFSIATGALTDLRIDAEIEIVDVAASVSPADTVRAVEAMRRRNVGALVTLGGDGTNRTVAGVWPEATLVPMSTGTNNVFPSLTEPTVAGAAAGLVACGTIDVSQCAPRSKMIEITLPDGSTDIALIDAVTLADDFVGNRMPAEGNLLRQVLVSRAHPASIGLSSLAGLLHPCGPEEDVAVLVECGPGGQPMRVPLAPGLYRTVEVLGHRAVALGEQVELRGAAVLSFDGDREHEIEAGAAATAVVRRDGPRVVNVDRALELGAAAGIFATASAPTGDRALNVSGKIHYHHADGTPMRDCC